MKKKKMIYGLLLMGVILCCIYFFYYRSSVLRSCQIRSSLEVAEEIRVYEGLPRRFELERAPNRWTETREVRKMASYEFYIPEIDTSKEDNKLLQELLSTGQNLSKLQPGKECGGFHPNYAVAWMQDSKESLALVCFGCGEIIYTNRDVSYRYDMSFQLRKVLSEKFKSIELKTKDTAKE